jgi:hypothetical protein
MHIDEYEFGRIRIDGHDERADLTLGPAGIRRGWWRKQGHVLTLEDLDQVLAGHSRTLVVGTGAFGRMQPAPGIAEAVRELGTEMEVMPTAAAVARINQLIERGEAGWAAALHLTC